MFPRQNRDTTEGSAQNSANLYAKPFASHDSGRYPKKIKLAGPELNYSLGKGVLVLGPSEPSIPCNDP